ncbi:MAG TPA: hypothetical protein VH372_15870, partial [Actinospica sp.]|nr:hypothetical protein [Actinospica sp.]
MPAPDTTPQGNLQITGSEAILDRYGRDGMTSARFVGHPDLALSNPSAPQGDSAHRLSAARPSTRDGVHDDPVVFLPINAIDQALFVRSGGLNGAHVHVLAELLDALPPILVHYPTKRLIDGAHRLAAAEHSGRTEIAVRYFRGDLDDAFRLAIESNIAHGLPLSLSDRKAAAAQIIQTHAHLSDRMIGRSAGLSPHTVATLRSSAGQARDEAAEEVRVGSDGRRHPVDASGGRLAGARIVAERPDATIREIAQEAGISVGTARDVKARLLTGKDPVPLGPAGAAKPAARAVDGQETAYILGRLRRDPTLRYSDAGRRCLLWLDQHV